MGTTTGQEKRKKPARKASDKSPRFAFFDIEKRFEPTKIPKYGKRYPFFRKRPAGDPESSFARLGVIPEDMLGLDNSEQSNDLHLLETELHIEAIAGLIPSDLREIAAEGIRAVLETAQARRVQPILELIARTKAETTATVASPYKPPPSKKRVADMTPEERQKKNEAAKRHQAAYRERKRQAAANIR